VPVPVRAGRVLGVRLVGMKVLERGLLSLLLVLHWDVSFEERKKTVGTNRIYTIFFFLFEV